jgi:hypothetical protein
MTSSIGPTRAELDAAEELGVEGHDDGRDAHPDGGHRRGMVTPAQPRAPAAMA